MTILGAMANAEGAVVWADSLVSRGGVSSTSLSKLAINPLGLCVGVGAGWQSLCAEADRTLLRGNRTDAIVGAVADALRKASLRVVPHRRERAPHGFAGNLYAVLGWSEQFERVCCWSMSGYEFFEPRLVPVLSHPAVPLPPHLASLPAPEGIAGVAALQAAELRKGGCEAGLLTMAAVTRHGITALAPRAIPCLQPEEPQNDEPDQADAELEPARVHD